MREFDALTPGARCTTRRARDSTHRAATAARYSASSLNLEASYVHFRDEGVALLASNRAIVWLVGGTIDGMGPTVSVMLPQPFSASHAELLTRMAVLVAGHESRWDDLRVVTTETIGGTFQITNPAESRPFGISAAELDQDETDVAHRLSACFGVEPISLIDIFAFCNSQVDHVVLGELTLYVTTSIPASFVSFGGDLSSHAHVGGVLVSLPYDTVSGGTALSSYGDAEFLRKWLQHEDFFMIK